MDIDEVVAAVIDTEDYKAIVKALATAKKAFIKDLEEVDSRIELDINKRSAISAIK